MQNPIPVENPPAPPIAPGCPACAAAPASRAPCFICGRIAGDARPERALQLAAIDALAHDLGARPHLPEPLRRDLIDRVERSRGALRPRLDPIAQPIAQPGPHPIARPVPRPLIPPHLAQPVAAPLPVDAVDIEPPRPILPEWLRRLAPAAAENLMYLLGGFLVVAGAVYFASTAWTTMSGAARLLLLDGGLLTLGAMLVGVGRLLTRGFADEPAGQRIRAITAHLAAGLGPVAAIIAGRAAIDAPLSGLLALTITAAATLGARRLADGPGHRRAALATLGITLGAAAAPLGAAWPIPTALVAGLLVGVLSRWVVCTPRGADLAHLGGATVALAAHVILATGVFGAGTVALVALAAGLVDHMQTRTGRLGVLALALIAVGPAFTALELLPLVCALATFTAARVALRLDSPPLLAIPLAASLLTYVTAPGPLARVVAVLKAAFAESMGYASEPVPLAWYGLTCLPYVLALAWAARRLIVTDRPAMARMTTGWLLLVMLGLCALAGVSSDPRAPMAVLAADGLVMLAIGLWLRNPILTAMAPLALVGSGCAAAIWLGSSPAEGLLLTEGLVGLALLAGLPIARRLDLHRPLLWAAAIPLLAAGLVMLDLPPEPLALPALMILSLGAGLRARFTAAAGWTAAAALLALGAVAPLLDLIGLDPAHRADAGALVIVGAIALHRALRSRPRRHPSAPRWLLPTALTAALVLWIGFGPANPAHPSTLALLGLMWAFAARRLHVTAATPVAVLLLATAGGWAMTRADLPLVYMPYAPALIGFVAVLLARRSTPWIRRHRTGLVEAGAVAVLAGAISAIEQSTGEAGSLSALAPLALVFLTAALAPRIRSTPLLHGIGLLVPIAAAVVVTPLRSPGDVGLLVLLIAPLGYAGLDLARALGRPILPAVDRFASALTLATALPIGALLALSGSIRPDVAPMCAGLAVLIGLAGRAVRRHPRAATAIALLLGLMLLWGPLALNLWALPPAMMPLLCAGTGLVIALGAHRIGLDQPTARFLAALIAFIVAGPLLPWTAARLFGESMGSPYGLGAGPLTGLLLVWAALVIALVPARLRPVAAALVAVPLAVRWPLLSGLLTGGAAPALELAALALLITRQSRPVALGLGIFALIATGGAVRSPLFALTFTAVAALPLLVARKPERGAAIEISVYALFAAGTAWLIALVPSSGRGPAEILPIIGLIAAALAALIEWVGPPVIGRLAAAQPKLSHHLDQRLTRTLLALAGLGIAPLLANIGFMFPRSASTIVLLAGLLTAGLLVATAIHHARRTATRGAIDAALLALAAAHLFAATRSDLLSALDGHHLLVWAAAAPILRVVGGVGPLTVRLRSRALLLPVPALLATLPDNGLSAIACLLAAATWGLAARQTTRPVFTGLGLTLLLAAACRLGIAMHVIDPAFYGLPAGLTLVLGAWIERRSLSKRAVEILQLVGIAIADLSVAVQVVRLEDPAHAMLLFALGLGTVAIGWRKKRGDLMIAGATAVVVDVTLHLLRTGFARGFLAAALLIGAGAVVLVVAGHHTRRRARD